MSKRNEKDEVVLFIGRDKVKIRAHTGEIVLPEDIKQLKSAAGSTDTRRGIFSSFVAYLGFRTEHDVETRIADFEVGDAISKATELAALQKLAEKGSMHDPNSLANASSEVCAGLLMTLAKQKYAREKGMELKLNPIESARMVVLEKFKDVESKRNPGKPATSELIMQLVHRIKAS